MAGNAPKLIVVVEDDDAVRSSMRTLLEALGFAVHEFGSAEGFLAKTDGHDADCLLLDYHLPGMTGVDLLELLRQRQIKTPAIMITANGKGLAPRLARAGGAMVLKKPIAGEALAQTLDDLFAQNSPQSFDKT